MWVIDTTLSPFCDCHVPLAGGVADVLAMNDRIELGSKELAKTHITLYCVSAQYKK